MSDLLPFLRLYRQHWLSLTIGLLLALVTPPPAWGCSPSPAGSSLPLPWRG